MIKTRLRDAESLRLAALHALELLDTESEERFDRITRLAQIVLDMPIALISLIDADRQWFKSKRGVSATEIPRERSLCTHVVALDRPVVVRDLSADVRFAANPLVAVDPNVRFYAGVPLHAADGVPVGTVCVLDHRPREFGVEQQEMLRLLGDIAEREFQSREVAETLALVTETTIRAAAVAESITEGLITLDHAGRVTSANRAATEMFGFGVTELVGTTALALVAEHDRDTYRGYLERYLGGESSDMLGTRRQVTGVRRDGSTFDMEVVVTTTDAGRQREFVAVCRDVSEPVRLERELRATREHLQLLSNAALEGLAVREHGVVVEANRAFTEIFGYGPDEVLGMALADFIGPEDGQTLRTSFPEGGSELTEAIGLRKDGSRFPIEFIAHDLSGGGNRRVVAIRDIAARRRAEERAEVELRATQRARRTIRAIVDAAREAMLFLGADGRIAFVNQGLFDLFTRGQPVALDSRGIEDFEQAIAATFGQSHTTLTDAAEQALLGPDAEIVVILEQQLPERRDLQLVVRPVFEPQGGYIGRLLVFRDITAERETDRLKSEFVATVAHELRTPLTSITGYVELLLEGDAGPLGPANERLLMIVQKNADRLAALVSDLLDVSQIEAGRVELRCAPEQIGRLIGEAVTAMLPQFDDKQQTFRMEIEDGLPAIDVDAPRLVQVMTNLLSNAHKYTQAGGHVTARATSTNGAIQIVVEDDGVGLSPGEIAQLFTKFYRARNQATREVGGTGLGLAITRSLVELHGGVIDVRSTPGRGSSFTVRLPLTGAAVAADEPEPAARPARARARKRETNRASRG